MNTSALRRHLIDLAKKYPRTDSQTERTDADAINFARQVEYQYAEIYDIQYPDLDMANGDVLPIDKSIPAGYKTFVYYTYGGTGMAAAINTYASGSIPMAGYQGKATTGNIVDLVDGYEINVTDVETAEVSGVPLESGLADSAKRGQMQTRNTIGWFGSPAFGLYGLLTHPNITQTVATTTWTSATFDQIAADVASLVFTAQNVTNMVEKPDTIFVSADVWNNLGSRPLALANSSNKTIAQWLVDNYAPYGITFKPSIMLQSANHAGTDFAGKNVAVALNSSPRKASLVVPLDVTILPPQWEALQMKVFMRSKVGGVKIPYPMSVTVMRGI